MKSILSSALLYLTQPLCEFSSISLSCFIRLISYRNLFNSAWLVCLWKWQRTSFMTSVELSVFFSSVWCKIVKVAVGGIRDRIYIFFSFHIHHLVANFNSSFIILQKKESFYVEGIGTLLSLDFVEIIISTYLVTSFFYFFFFFFFSQHQFLPLSSR